MSSRAGGVVAIAIVVAGLALAALTLRARDTTYTLPGTAEQLMYLRSGKVASRVVLSFKAIASDVYWIRAIQHYGNERKTSSRFALLQPLLDLTTTLDPHFNIAYRFGAIFLSLDPPNGPARRDQAIALLEKGLSNNPTRWQYAHDIAFIEYWYTGDKVAAARWFEKAAAMPGSPAWIRPLAATTLLEGGDRRGARTMLNELRGSEERYVRAAAERGLLQLDALDQIDELNRRVAEFYARTHAYPADLVELMRAYGFNGMPRDPAGTPYAYDPATHVASLSPASALNPLPKTLPKK
jgi:tetratricopeptide (TPR) repeat protein